MTDPTSAELSNLLDEKEKELSVLLENHQKVEEEKLLLQRQIIGLQSKKKDLDVHLCILQSKKKDLEIALCKSGYLIKQAKIDHSLTKSRFWKAKNAGL